MKILAARARSTEMGIAALAILAIAGLSTPARAETGIVRGVITRGGFIIGVGGGRGTLIFRGHQYPLSIGGMSFGATIGLSTTDLRGHAYHLRRPSDIEGVYSAIGAGGALAAGGAGIRLQNSRGVVLELTGTRVGVDLSVAVSGVEVRLR